MSRNILSQFVSKMRERKWRVSRVKSRSRKMLGWCEDNMKSVVVICNTDEREEFVTLIHEMLHAEFPDIKEETVEAVAQDLTAVLYDHLGCRLDWPPIR